MSHTSFPVVQFIVLQYSVLPFPALSSHFQSFPAISSHSWLLKPFIAIYSYLQKFQPSPDMYSHSSQLQQFIAIYNHSSHFRSFTWRNFFVTSICDYLQYFWMSKIFYKIYKKCHLSMTETIIFRHFLASRFSYLMSSSTDLFS